MSDLINGREMLKRYQEDLCYGIACKDCSMCTEDGGCRVEEWVDKFPSADRPQGEWIDMGDFEKCSVCKATHLKEFQSYYGKVTWIKTPYCPQCGARMKGAGDYERAIEQMEHDMLYEQTYNSEDGSM